MNRPAAWRILLVLPQLPQDPTSGAARSMLAAARVLAASDFNVRCIATTAIEGALTSPVSEFLSRNGIAVERAGREIQFTEQGIFFRLLSTGNLVLGEVDQCFGRAFDAMFKDELASFRPDGVFTYWGGDRDRARFRLARQQGAKVIYGLRNHSYRDRSFFDLVDAILTPAESLSAYYREKLGIESTPIPSIMNEEDVIASERDPIFITFVNPSLGKGVTVIARLAEELAKRRPDLPVLVVESRGSAGQLVSCGLRGGFDLRRHENIMISGPVPSPRDLFGPVRVLLVPSLQEAAARVAAEAMINGIPVLVSDRGGLPELVRDSRFVLPLPVGLTGERRDPVDADVVAPWIDEVIRLSDDEQYYSECCARVSELAQIYRSETLAPRYIRFFEDVLSS